MSMTPKQLKQIREDLGMSQRELGEQLGVTGPAIAQWESGTNPIPEIAEVALKTVLAEYKHRPKSTK